MIDPTTRLASRPLRRARSATLRPGGSWTPHLDLLGVVIAGAFAGWWLVASLSAQTSPRPLLALIVAALLLFAVGRILSAWRSPSFVMGLVALVVACAFLPEAPRFDQPDGGPLGYANANATVAGLGALSGAGAAATARRALARSGCALVALVLSSIVVLTGSLLGVACAVIGGVVAAQATFRGRLRAGVVTGVAAVSIALIVTGLIAAGFDAGGLRSLARERAELWSVAVDLAGEDLMSGAGPGRFAEVTALTHDADLRWAHHDFLQVGAELGLVGIGLLLALVFWAFGRLAVTVDAHPVSAAVGVGALTLVCLHASVDHVLHHAGVPLTLAVLLGAATAGHRDGQPHDGGAGQPSGEELG